MLGVLAVGAILSVAAVRMYQNVRARQQRFEAEQDLKSLAENARLIYSGRKNYAGISKSYLLKTGALKTEKIMGMDFSVAASENGKSFSIVFGDIGESDCAYFSLKKFDWAASIDAKCAAAPRKLAFNIK
jgi:Tfp pilus assembly protein PilE